MKKNILVTGGAGFIGSNLVKALLKDERVGIVRVMDNISTGSLDNISELLPHDRFEFYKGDIRNLEDCRIACRDIDLVSHQAALGGVPRSIDDPLTTNEVNITGSLHIFTAARETKVDRIVYAASSSAYGNSNGLPKVEDVTGKPISPYAVTKYVMELYADVFSRLYGMEFIGLRYFNVFGPWQNAASDYAAVIPLFFRAALAGEAPVIHGDGSHSRDFTYVDNVVEANLLALFTKNKKAVNEVYNIACGERTDLNQLWKNICDILDVRIRPTFGPKRHGDIAHSMADVSKAKELLDYEPRVMLIDGLRLTYSWYQKKFYLA